MKGNIFQTNWLKGRLQEHQETIVFFPNLTVSCELAILPNLGTIFVRSLWGCSILPSDKNKRDMLRGDAVIDFDPLDISLVSMLRTLG